MKTNVLSGALGSLLAISLSASYAAGPAGADRHEADAAAIATPAMEEVVVYGKRLFLGSPEERLRAELREQMRALDEWIEAELEADFKELITPKLELAGADFSPVVDLPPA